MASGCHAFLAVCTDAQPVAHAACAAMPSATAAGGTDQSQLMPESELNALLHEYHDRFLRRYLLVYLLSALLCMKFPLSLDPSLLSDMRIG